MISILVLLQQLSPKRISHSHSATAQTGLRWTHCDRYFATDKGDKCSPRHISEGVSSREAQVEPSDSERELSDHNSLKRELDLSLCREGYPEPWPPSRPIIPRCH